VRIEAAIVLRLFVELPRAWLPMREPLQSPAEGRAATGEGTPFGSGGRRLTEVRVATRDGRDVGNSGRGRPAAAGEGRQTAAEEDSGRCWTVR
jgi:hypothetical protein